MRAAFVALLAAALPAAARADKLDARLNDEMPAIKQHLDTAGYKNVGVLRFRVQKGKQPARFDNAPFNGNLAVRLENLLVIHSGPGEEPSIAVLREAGRAADKAGVGDWFADEKERKKLFAQAYPLAWGKKSVKPDAFLTGLVKIDEDLKKTTFTIACFGKDALKPTTIQKFTLDTDRDILRDLGYSFVLPSKAREAMVTKRQVRTLDEVNQQSLTAVREKVKEPEPSDIAGVEVTALVEGKPSAFRPSADSDGPPWRLSCPPQGKAFAIRLRNTTERTLGVVLKVNGISTFSQQTEPADRCRKWVIKAGKTWTVKGFYEPDGEKLALSPFEVLVGDEAKQARAELSDKAGLIEVDVFAEGGEVDEEEAAVSLRGLPPSKEKQDRGSYKAVRTALLQSANLKTETTVVKNDKEVVKREVIRPARSEKKTGPKFEAVDFESHFVARLSVQLTPP